MHGWMDNKEKEREPYVTFTVIHTFKCVLRDSLFLLFNPHFFTLSLFKPSNFEPSNVLQHWQQSCSSGDKWVVCVQWWAATRAGQRAAEDPEHMGQRSPAVIPSVVLVVRGCEFVPDHHCR